VCIRTVPAQRRQNGQHQAAAASSRRRFSKASGFKGVTMRHILYYIHYVSTVVFVKNYFQKSFGDFDVSGELSAGWRIECRSFYGRRNARRSGRTEGQKAHPSLKNDALFALIHLFKPNSCAQAYARAGCSILRQRSPKVGTSGHSK